eukprot:SAG31_NODE_27_length_32731_cov_1443.130393_20_plen_103_part_00
MQTELGQWQRAAARGQGRTAARSGASRKPESRPAAGAPPFRRGAPPAVLARWLARRLARSLLTRSMIVAALLPDTHGVAARGTAARGAQRLRIGRLAAPGYR